MVLCIMMHLSSMTLDGSSSNDKGISPSDYEPSAAVRAHMTVFFT